MAFVDYPHLIEDFLDNIGVGFESFWRERTGSWIFDYVASLQHAGVRSVLFSFSARVKAPWHFTHELSGMKVCVLPATRTYVALRRRLLNPYATTVERAFCDHDLHGAKRTMYEVLRNVAPYLTTPLRSLAREIRRERCDAILCQDYEHARFDACVLLGQCLRLPVVASFQGGDWQYSKIERPLRPLALRRSSGLIVGPRVEVNRLQSQYGAALPRLGRIFNPIDMEAWYPDRRDETRTQLGIPRGAQTIAWHGRVEIEKKGLDVLLEVWEKLSKTEPKNRELRLLLIGSGGDAARMQRHIDDRGLQGIIWINEFVRDRHRLRQLLSAADVYAFSSRYEGFPLAPVEAMACGLPVVATDVQGVADIFENGELSGGLVVPSEDARAFALALNRILEDDTWRRELGSRARYRAETAFGRPAIGRQLRDFIFGQ